MPFLHLLARRYIPGSKSGMMSLLESHCRSGDTFMQPAFLGQLIRSSVRGTLFVGPLPTAKPKAANPHKRCWCAFVCGNSNIACTLEVENLHPLKPNRVVCGMCQRFYVRFTNTYTHAGKNPAVQWSRCREACVLARARFINNTHVKACLDTRESICPLQALPLRMKTCVCRFKAGSKPDRLIESELVGTGRGRWL